MNDLNFVFSRDLCFENSVVIFFLPSPFQVVEFLTGWWEHFQSLTLADPLCCF